MFVTNANGDTVEYEVAQFYMDDELREQVHQELAPCSNQTFYDAYCALHREKYGVEFEA